MDNMQFGKMLSDQEIMEAKQNMSNSSSFGNLPLQGNASSSANTDNLDQVEINEAKKNMNKSGSN